MDDGEEKDDTNKKPSASLRSERFYCLLDHDAALPRQLDRHRAGPIELHAQTLGERGNGGASCAPVTNIRRRAERPHERSAPMGRSFRRCAACSA
jgi:hypothetical protein